MRKWVALGSSALLMSGAALAGGVVFHAPVAAAAEHALDVLVTNDAAHPVPVQEQNTDANGNIKVHEQGTANVNVTNSALPVSGQVTVGNLPTVQQVAGSVGISASGNGVQELNSAAKAPFTRVSVVSFGAGNPGAFNATADLFTVPAGERVVITYAGASVAVPAGEHAVLDVDAQQGAAAYLPLTDAGAFNVSTAPQLLTGGGPVSIVYDPGAHIVMHAFRSQGDGDNIGQLVATVSGFTVPFP
ncbi:hypothetical protein [Kitasatospora sp. LaBMicrA B282]|uniref:hypothetical protein n=1 Tax=Kitasatospora sp. LaBMicrA B282 TaxID=3420949 RepID=UPI003D14B34E